MEARAELDCRERERKREKGVKETEGEKSQDFNCRSRVSGAIFAKHSERAVVNLHEDEEEAEEEEEEEEEEDTRTQ